MKWPICNRCVLLYSPMQYISTFTLHVDHNFSSQNLKLDNAYFSNSVFVKNYHDYEPIIHFLYSFKRNIPY